MGLDLHELDIPVHRLGLYQAGVRYLWPLEEPNRNSYQETGGRETTSPSQPSKLEYPSPWSGLWARLQPPYTMVWTYWQLSEDLGAHSDARRRQMFRTILTKLGWPRGSVAFWPLSAFDRNGHNLRLDIFWSGVQFLQAQLVVVFGQPAFQTLFPDLAPCFGFTTTQDGLQIVHVPGPEDMLPDNREMKNLTWNMLCPLAPGR